MVVPQCQFWFAGRAADGGGNFSLLPGIAPSTAVLSFVPSVAAGLPQIGNLELRYGSARRVFRNCLIQRALTRSSTSGRMVEITISDRRWMWAADHFAASGEYNRYSPSAGGNVNEASAAQLAALLASWMGERGYSIRGIPTNVYPTVVWDADSPAQMLDMLCQQFGAIPTLTTNDTLATYRIGDGRVPLPDQRQMENTSGFEPPVIPRALVFEGGETAIDHDYPLRPLGLEVSGTNAGDFIPIENLSYTPTNGWGLEDHSQGFRGVAAGRARTAAVNHVWRLYGIRDDFRLPIPPHFLPRNGAGLSVTARQNARDYFTIKTGQRWRILPVDDRVTNAAPFGLNPNAMVLGYFALKNGVSANNDPTVQLYNDIPQVAFDRSASITAWPLPVGSRLLYTDPWTLDRDNGLVRFDDHVFFHERLGNGGDYRRPAVIRLRTSAPLRDPDTAAKLCQQYYQFPGSPIATNVAKIIKRSSAWFEYGTHGEDNADIFTLQALGAIAQETNEYQLRSGASQVFKGWVFDYSPDGVIRQVTFDSGESGGLTHVDFNMERPESYLTLLERRNQRFITFQNIKTADDAAKKARGKP